MKKVVFKGTINGKEFDNVSDYNNEWERILSEGETNICAYTETKSVDDEDKPIECESASKKTEEAIDTCPFNPSDYFPFFDGCSTDYYLDYLASYDNELNDRNYQRVSEQLNSKLSELKKRINNNDVDTVDILGMLNRIARIKTGICNDINTTNDSLDVVRKTISECNEKIKVLEASQNICALLSWYYNSIYNELKNIL